MCRAVLSAVLKVKTKVLHNGNAKIPLGRRIKTLVQWRQGDLGLCRGRRCAILIGESTREGFLGQLLDDGEKTFLKCRE